MPDRLGNRRVMIFDSKTGALYIDVFGSSCIGSVAFIISLNTKNRLPKMSDHKSQNDAVDYSSSLCLATHHPPHVSNMALNSSN